MRLTFTRGAGIACSVVLAACGVSPNAEIAATPPEPNGLIGGASLGYDSFAARASGFDGVAVVRVVAIGSPEWNTVDGSKPSAGELDAMLSGSPRFDYFIGRPVTLELVEMVRGRWTAPSSSTVWWKPGGQVDDDIVVIDDLGVPEPTPGQLAVAFTFDAPRNPTPGVSLYVAEAYPVQPDGRVVTPLQTEEIFVTDLPLILTPTN